MNFNISIISAFINDDENLKGNNAAVMFSANPLSDQEMQTIAADLNQPATSFLFTGESSTTFNVRWFAPDEEIMLCGHGALACGYYLLKYFPGDSFELHTASNQKIMIEKSANNEISIQLPVITNEGPSTAPSLLEEALGVPIIEYRKTNNKDIVVIEKEEDVKNMSPDFALLRKIDRFGYTVTAPATTVDFVSRTLVPHVQQLEDHATGSSHAAIVPYWAEKLGKSSMKAIQLSPRGGEFTCENYPDYIKLSGKCFEHLQGTFKM